MAFESAEPTLLVADGASRTFGYRTVVRDVSLSVGRGDLLTLIGPNGAGKTTLLRLLGGLLRPTAGSVARRGTVGMVGHQSMLYDALSARENLSFFHRLRGTTNTATIDAVLERVGLGPWRDERVQTFSYGMLRRLAIARVLLDQPDIVLCDEPLSGLDEEGTDTVHHVLMEMKETSAVVIVSHQYARWLAASSAVGFLVGGRFHGVPQGGGYRREDIASQYQRLLTDE